MNDSTPAPWLTSPEQVKDASIESLRRALLTSDGAGARVKEAALDELIERRINAIAALPS